MSIRTASANIGVDYYNMRHDHTEPGETMFAEVLLPIAAQKLLFTDLLCFHTIICLYAYYIKTEVTVIL